MELVLTIINGPDLGSLKKEYSFIECGGTIGSSEKSTWQLRDEKKAISELHLEIIYENRTYYFCDRSKHGTYYTVDHVRVPSHEIIKIKDGLSFCIGPFEIATALMHKNTKVQKESLHKREIDLFLSNGLELDKKSKSPIDVILKRSDTEYDVLDVANIIPPDEDLFASEENMHQSVLTDDIILPVFEDKENSKIPIQTVKSNDDSLLLSIFATKLNIDISHLTKEEKIILITQYIDRMITSEETINSLYKNKKVLNDTFFIEEESTEKEPISFIQKCYDVKVFYKKLNTSIDIFEKTLSKTFSPDELSKEFSQNLSKNWLGLSQENYWEQYLDKFSFLNEDSKEEHSLIKNFTLNKKEF